MSQIPQRLNFSCNPQFILLIRDYSFDGYDLTSLKAAFLNNTILQILSKSNN